MRRILPYLSAAWFLVVTLGAPSLPVASPASSDLRAVFDVQESGRGPLFRFGEVSRDSASIKPWIESPFPWLPDERAGRSVSVGSVTEGYVVDAVALPLPGRTWAVLPRQLSRGLLWTTEPMVELLIDAADRVAADWPGALLWIGNIGRRGGGDIAWSVSHNSGRDADLAFYSVDPLGRPVAPPDLLHFRDDGRSIEYGGYYRFDAARNWSLVEALLTSSAARVQYLFISDGLRAILLNHARAQGRPEALIRRAASVLHEPGPTNPHNDHFHLRIHCARADLAAGCEETGPGALSAAPFLAARQEAIRAFARDPDPSARRAAALRLARLPGAVDPSPLRSLLEDPIAAVRLAAVETLGVKGAPEQARWLAERWEEEDDPRVRSAMLAAAGQLGGRDGDALLATTLGRLAGSTEAPDVALLVAGADAAASSGAGAAIPALVRLLRHPHGEVRGRAADALRHITNFGGPDVEWRSSRLAAGQLADAAGAWRAWHESWGGRRRLDWVVGGFSSAGYPLTGGPIDVARTLASATGDARPWVAANAERMLASLTGNRPRSEAWSARDTRWYWSRWVGRNGRKVGSLTQLRTF